MDNNDNDGNDDDKPIPRMLRADAALKMIFFPFYNEIDECRWNHFFLLRNIFAFLQVSTPMEVTPLL